MDKVQITSVVKPRGSGNNYIGYLAVKAAGNKFQFKWDLTPEN